MASAVSGGLGASRRAREARQQAAIDAYKRLEKERDDHLKSFAATLEKQQKAATYIQSLFRSFYVRTHLVPHKKFQTAIRKEWGDTDRLFELVVDQAIVNEAKRTVTHRRSIRRKLVRCLRRAIELERSKASNRLRAQVVVGLAPEPETGKGGILTISNLAKMMALERDHAEQFKDVLAATAKSAAAQAAPIFSNAISEGYFTSFLRDSGLMEVYQLTPEYLQALFTRHAVVLKDVAQHTRMVTMYRLYALSAPGTNPSPNGGIGPAAMSRIKRRRAKALDATGQGSLNKGSIHGLKAQAETFLELYKSKRQESMRIQLHNIKSAPKGAAGSDSPKGGHVHTDEDLLPLPHEETPSVDITPSRLRPGPLRSFGLPPIPVPALKNLMKRLWPTMANVEIEAVVEADLPQVETPEGAHVVGFRDWWIWWDRRRRADDMLAGISHTLITPTAFKHDSAIAASLAHDPFLHNGEKVVDVMSEIQSQAAAGEAHAGLQSSRADVEQYAGLLKSGFKACLEEIACLAHAASPVCACEACVKNARLTRLPWNDAMKNEEFSSIHTAHAMSSVLKDCAAPLAYRMALHGRSGAATRLGKMVLSADVRKLVFQYFKPFRQMFLYYSTQAWLKSTGMGDPSAGNLDWDEAVFSVASEQDEARDCPSRILQPSMRFVDFLRFAADFGIYPKLVDNAPSNPLSLVGLFLAGRAGDIVGDVTHACVFAQLPEVPEYPARCTLCGGLDTKLSATEVAQIGATFMEFATLPDATGRRRKSRHGSKMNVKAKAKATALDRGVPTVAGHEVVDLLRKAGRSLSTIAVARVRREVARNGVGRLTLPEVLRCALRGAHTTFNVQNTRLLLPDFCVVLCMAAVAGYSQPKYRKVFGTVPDSAHLVKHLIHTHLEPGYRRVFAAGMRPVMVPSSRAAMAMEADPRLEEVERILDGCLEGVYHMYRHLKGSVEAQPLTLEVFALLAKDTKLFAHRPLEIQSLESSPRATLAATVGRPPLDADEDLMQTVEQVYFAACKSPDDGMTLQEMLDGVKQLLREAWIMSQSRLGIHNEDCWTLPIEKGSPVTPAGASMRALLQRLHHMYQVYKPAGRSTSALSGMYNFKLDRPRTSVSRLEDHLADLRVMSSDEEEEEVAVVQSRPNTAVGITTVLSAAQRFINPRPATAGDRLMTLQVDTSSPHGEYSQPTMNWVASSARSSPRAGTARSRSRTPRSARSRSPRGRSPRATPTLMDTLQGDSGSVHDAAGMAPPIALARRRGVNAGEANLAGRTVDAELDGIYDCGADDPFEELADEAASPEKADGEQKQSKVDQAVMAQMQRKAKQKARWMTLKSMSRFVGTSTTLKVSKEEATAAAIVVSKITSQHSVRATLVANLYSEGDKRAKKTVGFAPAALKVGKASGVGGARSSALMSEAIMLHSFHNNAATAATVGAVHARLYTELHAAEEEQKAAREKRAAELLAGAAGAEDGEEAEGGGEEGAVPGGAARAMLAKLKARDSAAEAAAPATPAQLSLPRRPQSKRSLMSRKSSRKVVEDEPAWITEAEPAPPGGRKPRRSRRPKSLRRYMEAIANGTTKLKVAHDAGAGGSEADDTESRGGASMTSANVLASPGPRGRRPSVLHSLHSQSSIRGRSVGRPPSASPGTLPGQQPGQPGQQVAFYPRPPQSAPAARRASMGPSSRAQTASNIFNRGPVPGRARRRASSPRSVVSTGTSRVGVDISTQSSSDRHQLLRQTLPVIRSRVRAEVTTSKLCQRIIKQAKNQYRNEEERRRAMLKEAEAAKVGRLKKQASLVEEGRLRRQQGRLLAAMAAWEQALSIARDVEDDHTLKVLLQLMGDTANMLSHHEQAASYLEERVARDYVEAAVAAKLGGKPSRKGKTGHLADAHGMLGEAYLHLAQLDRAVYHYTMQADMHRSQNNAVGEGHGLAGMGAGYHLLGRWHEALECHTKHLKLAAVAGNFAERAEAHSHLGEVLLTMGKADEALTHFVRQKELQKKVASSSVSSGTEKTQREARALHNRAMALLQLWRFAEAEGCYKRLLSLARANGDRVLQSKALCGLGVCALRSRPEAHMDAEVQAATTTADRAVRAALVAVCPLQLVHGAGGSEEGSRRAHRIDIARLHHSTSSLLTSLCEAVGKASATKLEDVGDGEGEGFSPEGAESGVIGHGNTAYNLQSGRLPAVRVVVRSPAAPEVEVIADARPDDYLTLHISQAQADALDEAAGVFSRALDLSSEMMDEEGVGDASVGLGDVAMARGNYATAIAYFNRDMDVAQSRRDLRRQSRALARLARCHTLAGDLTKAASSLKSCLGLCKTVGDKASLAFAHGCMGRLLAAVARWTKYAPDAAAKAAAEAALLAAQAGPGAPKPPKPPAAVGMLALGHLAERLRLCRELRDEYGEAHALLDLADAHLLPALPSLGQGLDPAALPLLGASLAAVPTLRGHETALKAVFTFSRRLASAVEAAVGSPRSTSTPRGASKGARRVAKASQETPPPGMLQVLPATSRARLKRALEVYDAAGLLSSRLRNEPNTRRVMAAKGLTHMLLGNLRDCLDAWASVFDSASEPQLHAPLQAKALECMGIAFAALTCYQEAISCFESQHRLSIADGSAGDGEQEESGVVVNVVAASAVERAQHHVRVAHEAYYHEVCDTFGDGASSPKKRRKAKKAKKRQRRERDAEPVIPSVAAVDMVKAGQGWGRAPMGIM